MTVVGPSAESPASRMADFTWALATGNCQVTPLSMPLPRTCSGAVPSAETSTVAPMARSGSATRRIGRRRSEASPSRVASMSAPAITPASRRMVVPELAQSSALIGVSQAHAHAATVECEAVRREVANPHATGAQARCGGEDICGGRRIADVAPALGKRSEDECPVTDRLVAGNRDRRRRSSMPATRAPGSSLRVAVHGAEESRGSRNGVRQVRPDGVEQRRAHHGRFRVASQGDQVGRRRRARTPVPAASASGGAPSRATRSHRRRCSSGRR